MCYYQQRFRLDVHYSALVLNFNNIFSNEHLYRAGQSMNSLPSQILERKLLYLPTLPDMRNHWKISFWAHLVVFLITTGYLTYTVVDQATTITYMKQGYEDTEYDLEQLASSIKGNLTKLDFSEILERYPVSADLKTLGLNRIKITFDKDNKVDSITTNW